MRVLIVEDETLIAVNLAMIVKSCGYEVAGVVENETSFLEATDNCEVDLALLDIRMQGVDLGLKFGQILKDAGIPFIFITSFSDRKILMKATSLRPHGFILKPFSRNDIANELNRINSDISCDFVILKTGSNTKVKIIKSSVFYLNSENVYVNLHTTGDRIVVRAKLDDICKLFNENELIRVHQSYAVNPRQVKRYSDSEIQLHDDTIIPVSRKFQNNAKTALDFS